MTISVKWFLILFIGFLKEMFKVSYIGTQGKPVSPPGGHF